MNNSRNLSNDCFTLPRGVSWTPVDTALEQLKNGLLSVVEIETISIYKGVGRILARPIFAVSSNPPYSNSAVDGYGFIGPTDGSLTRMTLINDRAAAGEAFYGTVPKGSAIRILTGAVLPSGIDTIVLDEDVDLLDGSVISLEVALKVGANTRKVGEDVVAGHQVFSEGHVIRPQDLALLASVSCFQVAVFIPLKVGVFSTGNELLDVQTIPISKSKLGQIYDSNRPMLISLLEKWNFKSIDLGIIPDDKNLLRNSLNEASKSVDAIITSGGASSGDEDHVSRLIKEEGKLENWRIAVKPGRPLALGLWKGIPIFGLPGNPVAAFVCALIFVKPALGVLSGSDWIEPQGYLIPASFNKFKKPGRREFLRARLSNKGKVEIFQSEGSGRISGLGWSTGLIEVMENIEKIEIEQLVKFIPYSSFGL